MINDIFSIIEEDHLKKPVGIGIDTRKHDLLVTFDNLLEKTNYIEQIYTIMRELKDKLSTPVDIEFACDGKSLYLLQCRPQSSVSDASSAEIPKDVAKENIVFTANKYVSNGKVPNIAYLVYVDPIAYSKKESLDDLKDIGKAVGLLNKKLPQKTFLLMGPGRWGSRDDIRLGVNVTYSDINNSAMLIEIAKTKGSYTPELSFGTHFFLDLVEANIRYLPLYPDDKGVIFNYEFLNGCDNTLTRFLPDYEHIDDCLRVINLREAAQGKILRVLMNADEEMAMGLLTDPSTHSTYSHEQIYKTALEHDEPLQWRKRMAESIALKLDGKRFGVKGIYLFGTVFNETAGPNSDIDLLVHFAGNESQLEELKLWFEGWNLCLSQINYNRSGYSLDEFLDITYIRDEDFSDQKYYVDIMNPNHNASKKLKMKTRFNQ
jgi:predicted nucleotidyltransferase